MFLVSVFLMLAAKVGRTYGIGTEDYVDVALVPFRSDVSGFRYVICPFAGC